MKKLFSLMLALVLCMSLTVPALAGGEDNVGLVDTNGTVIPMDKIPGGGVSYDESTKTLTLSGRSVRPRSTDFWFPSDKQ